MGRRSSEVNMTSKTVPEVTEVNIKTTEVTEAVEVAEKKQEGSLGYQG